MYGHYTAVNASAVRLNMNKTATVSAALGLIRSAHEPPEVVYRVGQLK